MKLHILHFYIICLFYGIPLTSQNFNFDFSTSGRRVCLVSSEVDLSNNTVKILFLDADSNISESLSIARRPLGSYEWTTVATGITPGTPFWTDVNVALGDVWEYQIRRSNTWNYQSQTHDAIGYTIGALLPDNSDYKGQMILLVANDISNNLTEKYTRLKKELTADGWFINELIVNRASDWDSGSEVVTIRNQIAAIYTNAPEEDKPKALFILGHVPTPRSGSTAIISPDDHDENRGARGSDSYYADIDDLYTDNNTYNPGNLATPLAVNEPNDFKWDQDFFPSDIEMGFGRVDFADLTEITTSEIELIENYLDRLSNYKNVAQDFDMGEKTGFNFGFDNSNDASFRSLLNISTPENVFQNFSGTDHNQWVEDNGPFKMYMQNVTVPNLEDWQNIGMKATVFSSDQSFWGYGDVPQEGSIYSRIRSLLGTNTKCLVTLWTTSGINMFHQAGTGMPLGIAMKEIMNHNATNQYLEKPPQDFDDERWWNRTHFAFLGDPTLNLYQVPPILNLETSEASGNVLLQWTSSQDDDVIGYHVYESSSEFGIYTKITTDIITDNSFIINNYTPDNWYMVKALKIMTSGSGQFIHSSLGKEVQGDVTLGIAQSNDLSTFTIYPNPTKTVLHINSSQNIQNIRIYGMDGREIAFIKEVNELEYTLDLSQLASNIYTAQITNTEGAIEIFKIIKN